MMGEPGSVISRLFISSMRSASFSMQRRQAPPDAEIEARLRVRGVGLVHVVTLPSVTISRVSSSWLRRNIAHWQFVGDVRRLLHDLDDRVSVLLGDRHVDARHQRKMVGHVAFVAIAEIFAHVLRPLVRLGQQDIGSVIAVDRRAQLLDDRVGFRQVFIVGAFTLHR